MPTHVDQVLADLMRRLIVHPEGTSISWHNEVNERPRTTVQFAGTLTLTDVELRAIQSERVRLHAQNIAEAQRQQVARVEATWGQPEPVLSAEQASQLRAYVRPTYDRMHYEVVPLSEAERDRMMAERHHISPAMLDEIQRQWREVGTVNEVTWDHLNLRPQAPAPRAMNFREWATGGARWRLRDRVHGRVWTMPDWPDHE